MVDTKPGGIVNHPLHFLVVVVEVCIVVGLFSDRPMCGRMQSDKGRAMTDLCAMRNALDAYATDHGAFPASLEPLVAPDERGHRYLNPTRVPRDPWDREYIYTREPVNVATLGADGKPGGTGDDADIDYASIVNGR